MISSYKTAFDYLQKGNDKEDRPLPGRATRLQLRDNGKIAVCYHETDVLTYCPDGTIVLDSGGWKTSTTKARINEYIPSGWTVYQDKGIWYLQKGHWGRGDYESYPFADGMSLNPETETVKGAGEDPAQMLKLKRVASTFASAYVRELLAGNVPAPSGGDCFFCAMREVETGKPLGELTNDDHIVSHIEEGYYVPSLLVNAIEAFPVGKLIQGMVGDLWNGASVADYGWLADIAKEQLTRSLRRYLYRQLGIAA